MNTHPAADIDAIYPLSAPAQDAIELQIVKFQAGAGNEITPYQGRPSPELDDNWESLYESEHGASYALTVLSSHDFPPTPQVGISKIPGDQATQLVNWTTPLVGQDQGSFIVGIDVFHQLHCLVSLSL